MRPTTIGYPFGPSTQRMVRQTPAYRVVEFTIGALLALANAGAWWLALVMAAGE